LHDAGYGFAVFRCFYAEVEVVIHDGIGDQLEFVSFQGLVEDIVHQVFDLSGVHEGLFLYAPGYGMVGGIRQADSQWSGHGCFLIF